MAEHDTSDKAGIPLTRSITIILFYFPVCSVHSSERLEKERDELRAALEDALYTLKEQHQKDQDELEERLQTFYQAEWDKVQLTYQEEADKCKMLMQEQVCPYVTFNHSHLLYLQVSCCVFIYKPLQLLN